MAFFSNDQITGLGGLGELASLSGQFLGVSESSQGAQAKYDAQKKIAALEMQADAQRRQAMEISARRNMLNATSQGAQFGSGVAGGKGTVAGEAGQQMLGVSQNLQIGENMFDINNQINIQKMNEADAESKIAQGQGMSSMFGAIGKAIPDVMKLLTLVP
jgi:hypothetical protein